MQTILNIANLLCMLFFIAACVKVIRLRKIAKETLKEFEAEIDGDIIELQVAGYWSAFDWSKRETYPNKHGKYFVLRDKDKVHIEIWNGSGWAYNHKEIKYWAIIIPPKQ